MSAILKLISEKPMGLYDIAASIHISNAWIRPYMKFLRMQRKIYINKWVVTEKPMLIATPLFLAGGGVDAVKPILVKSKWGRRKEIMKREIGDYDIYLARERTRRRKKPEIDPLISALFSNS